MNAEVKKILKVAREVAEEGFSDTTEDNVKEHTGEHRGTLTKEELELLPYASLIITAEGIFCTQSSALIRCFSRSDFFSISESSCVL